MVDQNYKEVYNKLSKQLGSSFEAGEIIMNLTGKSRHQLHLSGDEKMPEKALEKIEEMASRRLSGEPLQYLLGSWEFYSLPFFVGEGVLIPRADTETLVELALELVKGFESCEVLDLCAGSGCVGISIGKNSTANVTCVELSDSAFGYLNRNIQLNQSEVTAIQADVFGYVHPKSLDIIVSNPPYILTSELSRLQKEVQKEPVMALDGGEDGLKFYEEITKRYYDQLKTGGYLCFEIGIGQEQELEELLVARGYQNIKTRKDLGGITRVIYGQKLD